MKQSLKKIHTLIQEKQLSEAISSYHKLIEAQPQYADINNFYNTFYFSEPESFYTYERGNVNKDLRAYVNFVKQLLSEDETNVKLLVHVADCCYGFYTKKECMNAIRYCDMAIALDPGCKNAYGIKGGALEWLYSLNYGDWVGYAFPCNTDELTKIKENWETLFDIESDTTEKETAQRYINECEEKIRKCKIAQEQSRHIEDAERLVVENVREAIQSMDKAIALDAVPNTKLMLAKGHMLLKARHFERAREVFESSIPYFTNEAQAAPAFEGLGTICFRLYQMNGGASDLACAVKHLKTAYDSYSYDQRVNLLLAEAYAITGDFKQTLAVLKKALQKNCDVHRTTHTIEELKTSLLNNASFDSFVKDKEARVWMGI